ncbi:hypothetical protein [Mucilaginibacter sp. SJ]|uniref:hypothetical protein n=1 Tax=Mucilaginibacter sp. SJ TaxID=3029053 RepID=UPI0023A9F968|nr:hypothetical protein [Mucilaginibacter sp. SJ]WEA00699.1 hypothetical protein MusilaSJ_24915 [Mucilaginibacter sp. SJ]
MKTTIIKRKVNINPKNSQWKLYQQFKKLTAKLDTLPGAGEVQNLQHKSAPQDLIEMVF